MTEKQAAPDAGTRDPSADADPAETAKACFSESTKEYCWFLRQVAADQALSDRSVGIAIIYGDHANAEDGLIFVSARTAGRIRGRDEKNVRKAIKQLVERNHLKAAGYVYYNGVRVKAYRRNVWDERVRERFDQEKLGIARAMTDQSKGMNSSRSNGSKGMKSSRSNGTESSPSKFERDDASSRKGRNRPGEWDDIAPLTVLLEPSDSQPSTTTTSSLPTKDSDSKKRLQPEDDDLILLREIAVLHGHALTKAIEKRWRVDLFTLRVRLGIDLRRHLLPAIQDALIAAGKQGKDRLTPTTTLLGRFEIPAGAMKESFDFQGDAAAAHWCRLIAEQAGAVVASRQPPAPKAPPKARSLRDHDRRRAWRRVILLGLGLRVLVTGTAPWLCDEAETLVAHGVSLEQILAACRQAREAGHVPADLKTIRRQGGLTKLLEPFLPGFAP